MKYGLVGDSSLYTKRNNKKKHLGLCGTKIQVWNWILAKKNGFVPLPKLLRDEWHQSIKAIVQVLQVSTCLATLFFAWAMSVRSFYVYYIYICRSGGCPLFHVLICHNLSNHWPRSNPLARKVVVTMAHEKVFFLTLPHLTS